MQRMAIRRDAQGRRRIVLATAIAETSLTLDGVSVVVDSGLSRRAEFDVAAGVTHLVTARASQAAAAQRAGRAARQGPGAAYRLWEEAGHAGRPAFDPPEMLTADLAPLTLSLAQWGAGDPRGLAWIDPPPAPALAAAQARLVALGALDAARPDHAIRPQACPAADGTCRMPRWCCSGRKRVMAGRRRGWRCCCRSAGWAGGAKISHSGSRAGRASAARAPMPRASWPMAGREGAEKLTSALGDRAGRAQSPGILLARALPDNLARRRDASGASWLSAGGRGYLLDPASRWRAREWLAIGDATGQAKAARITAAWPLMSEEVESVLAERIERRSVLNWNAGEARVEARLERRLGAITLASGPDPAPDPAAAAALLAGKGA